MKRIRIFSGCAADQTPFIQLVHENAEDPADKVVLAQLTPQEAVQMGVYLIGAGSEAQCDAAAAQYLIGAAQAAGAAVEAAAQTAGKAIEGMRHIRRAGLVAKVAGVSHGSKKN